MLQPENQSLKYEHLFADIDTGRVKIPKFQRDFVWGKEKSSKLIDSILKGYPIGTFILWRTKEELRNVKEIGNAKLPTLPKGELVSYILDGQQRITSLYAIRKGLRITSDGAAEDYKDIFIDLSLDPDTEDELTTIDSSRSNLIAVHDILTGDITKFLESYSHSDIGKISKYRQRLTSYDFSVITLREYPIDVACEVFTRINTGGQELTLFEVMVAKTYAPEKNFDLAERFEQLLHGGRGSEKCLDEVGYGSLRASVLLQCVAAKLVKQVRRHDILRLSRHDFVEAWEPIISALQSAIDYVRSELRILVSELLPYDSLLVPLTYFFLENQGKKPTLRQSKLLQQYFFWASLGQRYSSATEGKIATDLQRIDRILANEIPSYMGEEVKISQDALKMMWFSASSAVCKTILCIYAYHEPKSFETNARVHLDNSWLKRSDSKNYHHFFPRAFLAKRLAESEQWRANLMMNITLVDDYLNKRVIRDRAPSDYIATFAKNNQKIVTTLATHLIGDLIDDGITSDDYEIFLERRTARVYSELKERLAVR